MITISIALLTNCERFKGKSLCKIIHIENDIGKIKARLPQSTHAHDLMSICMLKICGDSIKKP